MGLVAGRAGSLPWRAPNSLPTGSQAGSRMLSSCSDGNWSPAAPGTGEPLSESQEHQGVCEQPDPNLVLFQTTARWETGGAGSQSFACSSGHMPAEAGSAAADGWLHPHGWLPQRPGRAPAASRPACSWQHSPCLLSFLLWLPSTPMGSPTAPARCGVSRHQGPHRLANVRGDAGQELSQCCYFRWWHRLRSCGPLHPHRTEKYLPPCCSLQAALSYLSCPGAQGLLPNGLTL